MLSSNSADRAVIERLLQSLSERDQPLHTFGSELSGGRRCEGLDAHLVSLPHLVEHQNYGEDDKPGHELKSRARVDVARVFEDTCQRSRENRKQRDRQAEQEE